MDVQQKWNFAIIATVSFVVGFFAGYEAKPLRIRYLEWKRDRLAKKLRLTQAQIENATTSNNVKNELELVFFIQSSKKTIIVKLLSPSFQLSMANKLDDPNDKSLKHSKTLLQFLKFPVVLKQEKWDPTRSLDKEEQLPPQFAFRIQNDLKVFFTDPIADIMLAPDVENLLIAHAIIIGRDSTPYEGGFFYFYIKFPSDYPLSPPMVKLMTTGQNTVRFNPNFYSNGKVCASILNTWSGPQWNPGSTLYSVLLSIQSIMNEEPYYNEPGYGATWNNLHANQVKQYNDIIRHETIRVAVIGMLEDDFDCKNMPDALKDYITEYFKTKISYYEKEINANIHLDGQSMMDPFKDERGLFQYKNLKLKMEKLKQKHLPDGKTNNVGSESSVN